MTDKPPYQVGTNDLYYNCIDLRLLPEPDPPLAAIAAMLALGAQARRRRPASDQRTSDAGPG